MVWADAIKRAGGLEFEKVVEALNQTDMNTPVGHVNFDEKGDLKEANYVWYKWSNGQYAEDPTVK
jgi:branched-chain amino acid transport system substrate-binding protein